VIVLTLASENFAMSALTQSGPFLKVSRYLINLPSVWAASL